MAARGGRGTGAASEAAAHWTGKKRRPWFASHSEETGVRDVVHVV